MDNWRRRLQARFFRFFLFFFFFVFWWYVLVINFESGFNALPNELFRLIGDQILEDRGTLNSLTQVSKRCHDFFNSFLYRNVSDAAISTLALSERSRLPLTGAHPASFVYKVSLSLNGTPTSAVFRKQLASAMKNIALHTVNDAIQSFAFSSKTISLLEAIGGTIPPALRHVEKLFLAFPFPPRNNRLNLSLAVRFLRRYFWTWLTYWKNTRLPYVGFHWSLWSWIFPS